MITKLNAIAKRVANSAVRSSALVDPDVAVDWNWIKSNMTLDKFMAVKKAGATF